MKMIPEADRIAGAIADIEKRRLATEHEAGMALARSSALHRLQELLDHETEALRLRGPHSAHLTNVEVVRSEIGRVKRLDATRPARRPALRAGDHETDASAGHRRQSTIEDQI